MYFHKKKVVKELFYLELYSKVNLSRKYFNIERQK